MNAMSRDIQFVLHQHSKSPQLSGLGPTQRFKRSLKLLCYLHARPGFEPLTLTYECKCSNHQAMKANLLEGLQQRLMNCSMGYFLVSQQIPQSVTGFESDVGTIFNECDEQRYTICFTSAQQVTTVFGLGNRLSVPSAPSNPCVTFKFILISNP